MLVNTQKVIDLRSLMMCITDADGNITARNMASEWTRLAFADQYMVLTTDSAKCADAYEAVNPQWIVRSPSFPNLDAEESCIAIALTDGTLIDRMCYASSMHQPLLTETKGVSLDRISASTPSTDASNWISAASTAGFRTPTAPNSQHLDLGLRSDRLLSLPCRIFTPDGDGQDDELVVGYTMPGAGWTGTVRIYSPRGVSVRTVVSNGTLDTTGTLRWDGTDDGGQRMSPGTYIVLLQAFAPDGSERSDKTTCVLGVGKR